MQIPGLPASRQNVSVRAEREGWYSEERIGIGGRKKVYEVPERYLRRLEDQAGEPVDQQSKPRIARVPVNHSMQREPMPEIDASAFIGTEGREEKLRILGAIDVLLYDNRLTMPMDKKLRLTDLIYEHFKQTGQFDDEQIVALLKAATM
ncbi:DNA-binding protein [Chitinibacter sp. S2-10]|uniref:DNA-binding protein n=1 Tax=Chitinibacter sp. S2-10 TaxID=3373597 RepID=UPI0039779DDD